MPPIEYSKLSDSTKLILHEAYSLAKDSQYDEVSTTLIMIAIVKQSKDMLRFILDDLQVDYGQFCTKLSTYLRSISRFQNIDPQFSEQANKVILNAITSFETDHRGLVPPEAILLEISNTRNEVSSLFQEFSISKRRLASAIETYSAGNRITMANVDESSVLNNLERYAVNLRKLAENGVIEPTIGRDDEIRRILQIISRKTKNNPLLIGDPGTGKTAIVEGLASRLNRGDVPGEMRNIQIYSLDVATLLAGASMQGEFESRLKTIVAEIKSAPQVVLFIDEIHLLLGAGNSSGALDAANILKPELARNGLKVIGATTFEEYNKFIESDQAFARRFQRIIVEEPSIENSISILRGIKPRYEAHHKIKILDEAIVSAVTLSAKYITDRFLPDKAIDILDESASRMRIDRSSVPAELDSLSRLVRQKEIERESLLQDGLQTSHIVELEQEISLLKDRENILNAKWINERRQFDRLQVNQDKIEQLKTDRDSAESIGKYDEAARIRRELDQEEFQLNTLIEELANTETPLLKIALDSNEIKETIAKSTGIPINSMSNEERHHLIDITEYLNNKVIGQEEAIESVSNIIKRSRLGLGNEAGPIGSFLFMGTTGVGKTELAKTLAEFLFGSRDMLIRIDMSEYQQEHSISRLFGAPPGYIGYDQGGQLTEAIRRKPYSVILLDEIEKAHPKICETLLQVLDDGRMTDGKGRTINFKNSVIIMTSNLGAEHIEREHSINTSELKENLIQLFKQRTSPEFVNRIDDIVIFNPLSKEVLRSIASKIVIDTILYLKKSDFEVIIDEDVSDFIASTIDTSMGARPIKRMVNHLIIDPIVEKTLIGELVKNQSIKISLYNNILTFSNE